MLDAPEKSKLNVIKEQKELEKIPMSLKIYKLWTMGGEFGRMKSLADKEK